MGSPPKIKNTPPKNAASGWYFKWDRKKYIPVPKVINTKINARLYANTGENILNNNRLGRKKIPVWPSPKSGNPVPMYGDQSGNELF